MEDYYIHSLNFEEADIKFFRTLEKIVFPLMRIPFPDLKYLLGESILIETLSVFLSIRLLLKQPIRNESFHWLLFYDPEAILLWLKAFKEYF